MKVGGTASLRGPLRGIAVALVLALVGYLMLRGQDPMQALLFEEKPQVVIGLFLLIACRIFLLFVAPGWLLNGLLSRRLNRSHRGVSQ